ncbi:MAG: CapA family protein [Lentimicrobiaceae bacterium]|nr:CapA family protein [Lentimicrobiaceae bacterium]
MINIIGVGDIMPGGILSGKTDGYLSTDLITVMKGADIRVGTLETAVGDTPTFYHEKMSRDADVIYVKDKDLSKLKDLDINIVSLANNHFFDLGIDGAKHTIEMLDSMGIKHVGAGNNIEEASKAVIENINGETVAFLGFCDYEERHVGWCPYATHDKPGVNPMYKSHVTAEIRKYKSMCDYVVVLPHWGKEHTYTTTLHVHKAAKSMIKAGADLILGSHPHRVQPVVNFNRAAVAYSLGNFLFPNRLLVPPRSTYYSETEVDIKSLPSTNSYPIVEELTYKRWKPLAMIGMIAEARLSKRQTKATYKLTLMHEDGSLDLYANPRICHILSFRKIVIKYTPYSVFWFIRRCKYAALYRMRLLKDKLAKIVSKK